MPELPFPDRPLADEVVRLRPWRESDVPTNLMAFSDPLVQQFSWPQLDPYTEDDARYFFAEWESARLSGEAIAFALVDPEDDEVVLGGASVHEVNFHQRRAALGYWLAPQARGRGVATHAVRLLARWGFDALGLARIELTCGPDNVASQRLAERCGFTHEGVLRSHLEHKGKRRDTVVFSLLADELD